MCVQLLILCFLPLVRIWSVFVILQYSLQGDSLRHVIDKIQSDKQQFPQPNNKIICFEIFSIIIKIKRKTPPADIP